jgi:hypothetical protein
MPIVLWIHRGRLPATVLLLLLVACDVPGICGQHEDQSSPGTDVLLFADGERLTGHFVKASGSSLTFKSDVLGEITVG